MKLEKLHIKNYKSLVDLEIIKPNPFTVFAGPNGAGKSNIFEALEFGRFLYEWNGESAVRLFGGKEDIKNRLRLPDSLKELSECEFFFNGIYFSLNEFEGFRSLPDAIHISEARTTEFLAEKDFDEYESILTFNKQRYYALLKLYIESFSRVFIKNADIVRVKEISDEKLSIDCANLEKVLKRLLDDEIKREDITEYLELFIPGFERIEINSDNLSGTDTLLIYEKGIDRPFTKNLISDGTYNILCLLTAVFQSEEPQFLCIEEPENGLNPFVIETFVDLFRNLCEDKGHYIWLNTHSQTLIRGLKEEELIMVDKVEGATKIKQFKAGDFYGLRADEAWLSNVLGTGLPW